MSKLIELTGGTLNPIHLDPAAGVVIKGFHMGNGVVQDVESRKRAEIYSLQQAVYSPVYKGHTDTDVYMSYIDGENELDTLVTVLPEAGRAQVFRVAGETLARIHETHAPQRVPAGYHESHQARFSHLLEHTKDILLRHGVSHLALFAYLLASYDTKEIEKRNFVWIHGDFWLNNIIGNPRKNTFRLHGVIDWEIARCTTPYEDFAIVRMSIEDMHKDSAAAFWKGYGHMPNRRLQAHYAIVKTLEWISGEDEENPLDSEFYEKKFALMKEAIARG